MAARVVEVETVAARRPFAGVGSFTVHAEPASSLRAGLARWWPPQGRTLVTAAALVVAVLSAGAVGLLAQSAGARGSIAAPILPEATLAAPAAPAPVWIEVVRPIPLFDLGGSTFGRLPLSYRVKRLSDASERRDTLTYGTFDADTAAMVLIIHRLGPAPRRTDLPTDLARIAAVQKLALLRSGPPTPVPTRFGPVEAADLTVQGGARSRPCLGFQLRTDGAAPVAIAGLACGTDAKPVDRAGLTCVLDHLDLLSAGDDTALRDFFVAAEQRRGQGCGTANLSATRSRPTWLDGEAVQPPLAGAGRGAPGLRLPSRGPSEL